MVCIRVRNEVLTSFKIQNTHNNKKKVTESNEEENYASRLYSATPI